MSWDYDLRKPGNAQDYQFNDDEDFKNMDPNYNHYIYQNYEDYMIWKLQTLYLWTLWEPSTRGPPEDHQRTTRIPEENQ